MISPTEQSGGTGQSSPPAAMRHLPGKSMPREDALREYQQFNDKLREKIDSILWQFWAPEPDEFHRWRVELGCGCIKEVLTHGDRDIPPKRRFRDYVRGTPLPAGQMGCHHDDAPPAPYRDIVEWGTRTEKTFPADPVEPMYGMDAQTWAAVRRADPRTCAVWTVTLSCGHVTDSVTDLRWEPAHGPARVSAERQQELTAEFDELPESSPENLREREHTKRLIAAGWPRPQPEKLCHTCPHVRFIIAYERVGWLVPRKPKPKPPKPPSRAAIERRLRQAEADVDRLRDQLAELDAQSSQPG